MATLMVPTIAGCGDTMDPLRVYALLQDACLQLDRANDHAIAAQVSYAMALVSEKYGVGQDHRGAED